MLREEPYLGLTSHWNLLETLDLSFGKQWWQVVHGCRQLVSWDVWLSPITSATIVLNCYHIVENLKETADDKSEEDGDDVKSSCPLRPGLQACYNGWYNKMQYREVEQISKASPSPDWSLQLDSMKLESLVIPNQNVGVNTFPGVVHTARHAMGVDNTRSW